MTSLKQSLRLFTITLSFLFISALSAQAVKTPVSATDPNGIDSSALSGHVITVTEFEGESLGDLSKKTVTQYADGKVSTETQYDDNDSQKNNMRYEYNEDGKITSIKGTDQRGNLKWKYEYTYDSKNHLTQEASYNDDGKLEWNKVYTYNSRGLISNQTTYNADASINLTETYQYNGHFISAYISQYPDGKLLKRTVYTYTKGGHIAYEYNYNTNGLYEIVGYSYSEHGILLSFSISGANKKLKARTILKYNSDGKLILETTLSADNTIRSEIKYLYDEKGNWVWKQDDKTLLLRDIQYGDQ